MTQFYQYTIIIITSIIIINNNNNINNNNDIRYIFTTDYKQSNALCGQRYRKHIHLMQQTLRTHCKDKNKNCK